MASWLAAYRGLLPDAVLADLDEPGLAADWRVEIERPPDPTVRVWVVQRDGVAVAYSRTGPPRDPDLVLAGSAAEIYGFYVHPDGWGSGIGRGLMQHVLDDLGARGYGVATLNVVEGNERARAFYERVGFSLDRAASPWYGAPQVRYRKEL